jgi:hypothetical protein
MLETLKKVLAKLPLPGLRPNALQLSQKTSQALRQLVRRYQRQKRLWIYIILSSMCLMVLYIMFSLLWTELWQGGGIVPVAWIILAGVGIAIYQVRRCNDVIRTLKEAYVVQSQIEKADAEKAAEEAAEEEEQQRIQSPEAPSMGRRSSSNGSQTS